MSEPKEKNLHVAGAKDDSGKNRVGLVFSGFAESLEAVARVGTFGANKYTPYGWLEVPNAEERYTDAMLRHYLKERTELFDTGEGGSMELHAAAVAWNALARLHFIIQRTRDKTDKEVVSEQIAKALAEVAKIEAIRTSPVSMEPFNCELIRDGLAVAKDRY